MRYFDHDTTASMDDKIIVLRIEHGSAAIDCYWTLLEKMYADEAPLNLLETNLETKALTYRLGIGYEQLETFVNAMISIGLLESENGLENVYSKRAIENIGAYVEKCETARQNGKKGGRKPRKNQTDNLTLTDGKADAKLRKEKKGIGFDKQNQIPNGGAGAGGEDPAPRPADKAARDMEAQRALVAEMEANAVPMPDYVRRSVMQALTAEVTS